MQCFTSLPSATKESGRHLNQLLNTVNESVNTFKSLDRPVDKWDDILVYFVESKLPPDTRRDWAREVERKHDSGLPKYAEIKSFIEDRIRTWTL